MKKLISLLTVSVFIMVVFTACEEDSDENPAENEIIIENSQFVPENKTVQVGTTVKWINNDQFAHTVTSPVDLFDSGTLEASETFEYTFQSTGTFEVICNFHPEMTGTVTVEN